MNIIKLLMLVSRDATCFPTSAEHWTLTFSSHTALDCANNVDFALCFTFWLPVLIYYWLGIEMGMCLVKITAVGILDSWEHLGSAS